MGEYLTHTTRSVGSNPTHGVEVSGAEIATEVRDGGEEAELCAVEVGGRNLQFLFISSYDETLKFCYLEIR